MAAQLIAGCIRSTKTFYHSGDLGDIIYSLPTVKALGGGAMYLGPDGCKAMMPREPMTMERFNLIAPLLRVQPYVDSCEYRMKATGVDYNLNQFKYEILNGYEKQPGANLARAFLKSFNLPLDLDLKPWLTVDSENEAFPVVIARSPRFHASFGWKRILETYRGMIGFVGLKSEHEEFCKEFGDVPYCQTQDLLELAQVIAGSRLFVGNQSSPFSIAVGLGKRSILEMSSMTPNTIFRRAEITYSCSEGTVLPSVVLNPGERISSTPESDVTVVITNFQRANFLKTAFDSCVMAGVGNIVISSSGATSEVQEVHAYAKRKHPGTIIVSEAGDSGSNTNWLRGVEASRTKWVQILHDDDKLLPNYLSLLQHLQDVDFVCWDSATHGASNGSICRLFETMPFGDHAGSELLPHILNKPLSPSPVSGCFKRDQLIKTLQICSHWGSEFIYHNNLLVGNDLLIWLLAAKNGKHFKYIASPLTSYGFHSASATVKSLNEKDGRLHAIYGKVRDLFASNSYSPKLCLDGVTVVGIDNFHPLRTLRAMRKAEQLVQFADSVLVTSPNHAQHIQGVNVLPLITGINRKQREQFMICDIAQSFTTSHCLHMEWDAGILNTAAWDNNWLEYDFIGAPWTYPHTFPGFPPCTRERCVGNFGFSLISKRMAVALSKLSAPNDRELAQFSDVYVCMKLRPMLETVGIRFAPEEVALKFSCECKTYVRQFGWHGQYTAHDNNFPLG